MNRIITADEATQRWIDAAKNQTGGDERAAMILLCLASPMIESPPQSEIDYLNSVLDEIEQNQ